MPAQRIGRVVNKRIDTRKIAQATRSHFKDDTPLFLLIWSVARNVIAPASEEAPRNCNDNMANDTACDAAKSAPVKG